MQLTSPSPNNASLVRKVAAEPSRNYLFSARVKTEGVEITEKGGRFGARLHANRQTSEPDLVETHDWKTVFIPITTGAKAKTVTLRISLGGTGSVARGRVLIRDVRFRPVEWGPAAAGQPSR